VTVDPHWLSTPGPASLRRTPLAERAADLAAASSPDVTLTEAPQSTMVNLRVKPGTDAASEAERALGAELPAPNQASTAEGEGAGARLSVLWLGPDEFLLVAPPGEVRSFATLPGATTDVSHARAGVDVRGPEARAVLATGCSLDLHPEVFPAGSCAQTLLARAGVLIWHRAPGEYRVLTGTSFAGYLVDWLTDAAAEYAAHVSPGATSPVS
jgi:sarcosine oxidase, subunit gamma